MVGLVGLFPSLFETYVRQNGDYGLVQAHRLWMSFIAAQTSAEVEKPTW
jgi:hypothetical protein